MALASYVLYVGDVDACLAGPPQGRGVQIGQNQDQDIVGDLVAANSSEAVRRHLVMRLLPYLFRVFIRWMVVDENE